MDDDEIGVGYGRPPRAARFQKGRSGNPAGRPKGKRSSLPHETILGQSVTIVENGVPRQVTAEEAFLKKLLKDSLSGKDAAALDMLGLIERAKGTTPDLPSPLQMTIVGVSPGSVTGAVEKLRMGRKLDRYRDTAALKLEPWIVQMALERFAEARLSVEGQRKVVATTRTPQKVTWPGWWTVKPRKNKNM